VRIISGYSVRRTTPVKKISKSDSSLLHIYTFKNRKNTQYIINVEEFHNDIFIVKFFTKALRLSNKKFNYLTDEKDARRIIFTCVELATKIYTDNPLASFGFIGSPTPKELNRDNKFLDTKRFKVYTKFAKFFFSPQNFLHTLNPEYSLYILYNKNHISKNNNLQKEVMEMFEKHFIIEDLFR